MCVFFVIYIWYFPYCLFASSSQVIGCKDRLRTDLYCVGWGVKLYSTHSMWLAGFENVIVSDDYWCCVGPRNRTAGQPLVISDVKKGSIAHRSEIIWTCSVWMFTVWCRIIHIVYKLWAFLHVTVWLADITAMLVVLFKLNLLTVWCDWLLWDISVHYDKKTTVKIFYERV